MAWSRDRVDSSNINNGNEYQKGDRVSRQQLNAMVNAGLYSQDFVEALTETPVVNNEEVNANPTVNLIPYEKNGKEFYKFEFNNIKGKTGETGPAGTDGKDGTNGLDGESANILSATAEISNEILDTPVVDVQLGGTPLERTFHFVFKGILGGSVDVSNKAEVDASNLSDDNVTAWKEKLNIGSGLPIGTIIPSAVVQNDAGLHLLDGGEIVKGGVYDSFYNWVIANLDRVPQTDIYSYNLDLIKTGSCGKFVINNTDTQIEEKGYVIGSRTIKLPTIAYHIEGLSDISEIGTALSAGLPNITGEIYSQYVKSPVDKDYWSGALSLSTEISTTPSSGSSKGFSKINFDASQSNSIYGNSTTVQTNTVKYPYYIVIGTTTKTDIEVNIDNVVTDLNNKADKDASNLSEENIASWQDKLQSNDMPSDTYEDFTISSSGDTYTAQADGYISFRIDKSSSGASWMSAWIKDLNLTNLYGHAGYIAGSGGTNAFMIPIKKGNTFSVTFGSGATIKQARFFYKEGAL